MEPIANFTFHFVLNKILCQFRSFGMVQKLITQINWKSETISQSRMNWFLQLLSFNICFDNSYKLHGQ